MNEFYDEADIWPRSPGLQQIVVPSVPESPPCDLPKPPRHRSSSESSASPSQRKRTKRKKRPRPSQGDVVLLHYLAPDRPDIAQQAGHQTLCSDSDDRSDTSEEDPDSSDENLDRESAVSQAGDGEVEISSPVEVPTTQTIHQPVPSKPEAAAALDPIRDAIVTTSQVASHILDSQMNMPNRHNTQSPPVIGDGIDRRNTRSRSRQQRDQNVSRTDHDLEDRSFNAGVDPIHHRPFLERPRLFIDDSHSLEPNGTSTIATSPKLQPHLIPPASRSPRQMLPAIHPESPTTQDTHGSPEQQLPSVVRRLIKNIAPEIDAVPFNVRPRTATVSAPGAVCGLSPTLLARPFHVSPTRHSRPSTRDTPSTVLSDRSPSDRFSIISPAASTAGPTESDPAYRNPRPPAESYHFPPSLKANSSSNTSHPSTGSSSDGLTPGSIHTPGDQTEPTTEGPRRPLSQGRAEAPTQSAPTHTGVFRCTFDGCNAAPFQTLYLLHSHFYVHSDTRPHYCPFRGCPHAKGGTGKGFKRKNEMNRHQLVHQSPNYVCPFCPDREHRYPRRDNLQRHVKQQHEDKDMSDPILREVLNQRTSTAVPSISKKKRTRQG